MLFISHDLSVVRNVSDRIAVMYLGKVCEIGDVDQIYEQPAHPYTRALLASVPGPAIPVDASDGDIGGDLPSSVTPPGGCRFHPRCPGASDVCQSTEPVTMIVRRAGSPGPAARGRHADHFVACHHPVVPDGYSAGLDR